MRQVALYTRVSTDRQTTVKQEREPARSRVAPAERGPCLPRRRDQRSQGQGRAASVPRPARRQFDMAMAWSVDRLSPQDLIGFLSELHALGVDLMLHQQGLDTTTPAGKAMALNEMGNNKDPKKARPGEMQEGKFHFNPGNMSGKKIGNAQRHEDDVAVPLDKEAIRRQPKEEK